MSSNSNSGKIIDIDYTSSNSEALRQESEMFYKEKQVDFVKTYYAEDGKKEWKDPTTSRKVFFEIMKNINYSQDDVFMDCGCGLGHVVYLASQIFRKVIGVELLETVFKECENNIKLLSQKGTENIVLKQGDMFDIDDVTLDSVTIFYFSSPFDDVYKFKQWIDKLSLSYFRKKRKMYFIYYYPLFESEMQHSIFTLDKTINTIGKVNIYSVIEDDKVQKVEISENDYPSKEKIWDRLYQCRDFELSSFWQKSIFLFGFISLCFAGYGALLLKTAEKDSDINYLYECMLGICILGIALSYIWIAMCKGSKAWYEIYEKTIYQLETEIFEKEKDLGKYIEGQYAKTFRDKMDIKLFNNYDGGQYSPSKINIFIGNLLLVIWSLCGLICIANLIIKNVSNNDVYNILNWISFGALCIGLVYILWKFPKFLQDKVKSRILS